MIFRGTFEYALDAKHRLTVPPKYRPAFAEGVVLAVRPSFSEGMPKALAMWRPDDYTAFAEGAMQGLNPLSPRAQELSLTLYGASWDLELDSAGRLPLPALARQRVGLDREVTVTGSGRSLEIWDRAQHLAFQEAAFSRFPDLAASFDHTA